MRGAEMRSRRSKSKHAEGPSEEEQKEMNYWVTGGLEPNYRVPLKAWEHIRKKKLYITSLKDMPAWLAENKFIHNYYRYPCNSKKVCAESALCMHNETANIWTHGLGALVCVGLLIWSYFYMAESPLSHFAVTAVFLSSATFCLSASTIHHTFYVHSYQGNVCTTCMDYTGIAVLISGSCFPAFFYAFYCDTFYRVAYLTMSVVITSAGCFYLNRPGYKDTSPVVRAAVFVLMGVTSGAIPGVHHITRISSEEMHETYDLVFIMAVLYILGATLYGLRIPERFYPGKFDLFPSHVLHHLCVLAAVGCHFGAVINMYDKNKDRVCDAV